MPKLNITHLTERLAKRIQQLEQGEEIAARDINALLSTVQQQALKAAWAAQQALRKQHRQPSAAEKVQLGWKTIREVRLDIYRQAFKEAYNGLVEGMLEIQKQSETRAARVYLDAFSEAHKLGKNARSAGNIALTRAGFNTKSRVSKRDKEVNAMEEALRKKLKQ